MMWNQNWESGWPYTLLGFFCTSQGVGLSWAIVQLWVLQTWAHEIFSTPHPAISPLWGLWVWSKTESAKGTTRDPCCHLLPKLLLPKSTLFLYYTSTWQILGWLRFRMLYWKNIGLGVQALGFSSGSAAFWPSDLSFHLTFEPWLSHLQNRKLVRCCLREL